MSKIPITPPSLPKTIMKMAEPKRNMGWMSKCIKGSKKMSKAL